MQRVSPDGLADWVETWANSDAMKRQLAQRYVSATVTGVDYTSTPMQVQVQMDGDDSSSGGFHKIGANWYYPRVGDFVEMVWRDPVTAWVAWPKIQRGRSISRVYASTGQVLGGGPNTIVMDSTQYDGLGVIGRNGFLIAGAGYYRINFEATGSYPAGLRWMTSIYNNGIEVARGGDTTGTTNITYASGASATLYLVPGDNITGIVYVSTTYSITPGPQYTYLEIEWVP